MNEGFPRTFSGRVLVIGHYRCAAASGFGPCLRVINFSKVITTENSDFRR